ncbi:MAG: GTPase Era [Candidatus Omnitrophica bacterium]|nr:GTPase Era [Candidatus Omnitrophota bacterium]
MDSFKSGFVAIIGKPNVGKSTILNAFLRQKIAIVSEKPETTRDNIQGILTTEQAQIIFVDTPGIHRPHLLLGKSMVKKAKSSLLDTDLLLFVIDLASGLRSEDFLIIDLIRDVGKPAIAVINKIDRVSKKNILPIIDELKNRYGFLDFIPISAIEDDNIELLKGKILENLQAGEVYYPDGQVTDKNEIFQTSEIIREKVLSNTRQEVPHSVAVKIEKFSHRQDKDILDIEAIIYVERDSQKGIVVGKKGSMTKTIAVSSRQELEEIFKKKVFLQVWVKVLKDWRRDPKMIRFLEME